SALTPARPGTSRSTRSSDGGPDLGQRAVAPGDRVGSGQRHRLDVRERFVELRRIAAPQVPAHPVGIGADDDEVRARARVEMRGAGRQHEYVATPDLETAPARAAEDHRGRA